MLTRGLYRTLVTEALRSRLRDLDAALQANTQPLAAHEVGDRLALHLSQTLERAIAAFPDDRRTALAIALARRLIDTLVEATELEALRVEAPADPAALLTEVLARLPDGRFEAVPQPMTPLLDTTLLTNARGEPRVGAEIRQEIASADGIDVVMAFIRRSGLRPLMDDLRRHCDAGRPLRVLTTTYTGSTERTALESLVAIGAQVRVSYDTSTTRLHAKTWLFRRNSGFSTAYVGSSNLTHSAQVDGLEWNVRVAAARNPGVIGRIEAVFDSYWESGAFEEFDASRFDAALARARIAEGGAAVTLAPWQIGLEVRPDPFQAAMLERLMVAREAGRHRNLLVSATGTGKTVMAALDYLALRERLPRARLLFVAHRREILLQARDTFRWVMRDTGFGELWVDGDRPQHFDHVFASIQSLQAVGTGDTEPDRFDVVVIDEFHHAAAPSYRVWLDHLRPRELLGLTATPERADGQSVLAYFDGRIAAEMRLWDAIDQQRLAPFAYFGVHDGVDYRALPWRRGRGYDMNAVTGVYTADDVWVSRVLAALAARVDDPGAMRALGFCASVAHAEFMARKFSERGLPAVAVSGATPTAEREDALRRLRDRAVVAVFAVDLFNEGVDVPAVDTLLMLRPTDSATIFLQQLGRGLRRHPGKLRCTVLDFVGLHRQEFRLERRLQALMGGTRRRMEGEVERGFPFLPSGCDIELDPVTRTELLRSLREAVSTRWSSRVRLLQELASPGPDPSLADFLREADAELADLYGSQEGRCGWMDLRHSAGLEVPASGPDDLALKRAIGRLLHVDDPERLTTWSAWLAAPTPPRIEALTERERRLLRMLVASTVGAIVDRVVSLHDGLQRLWSHPAVRGELVAVFEVLRDRVSHLTPALVRPPDVPLRIHARYTRLEIQAAFGVGDGARVASWQRGVRWVPQARCDLFAFTLDKTDGRFSPTTRYKDYAISPSLLHWESQSLTREASETGHRYIHHERLGSQVMLFGRERATSRDFLFLGPATYVRHTGEMPMQIVWRLDHPIPGDAYADYAAAVA